MPSREIDFSFENAQSILQTGPLHAISSSMWRHGQTMINRDKMAPLFRPLGILLKGASRGITTNSDTAGWQSGISAALLGIGSMFVAATTAPGLFAGIGIVAGTIIGSAIVAPYALSLITATALGFAAIPKAIINLPESFKDASHARKVAAQKRALALKQQAAPPAEPTLKPAPTPEPPPLTLLQCFAGKTLEVQTKFMNDLAEKFPHHFEAAAQKIADRNADMKGILTTPAKLMAKPIKVIRKDTTTP